MLSFCCEIVKKRNHEVTTFKSSPRKCIPNHTINFCQFHTSSCFTHWDTRLDERCGPLPVGCGYWQGWTGTAPGYSMSIWVCSNTAGEQHESNGTLTGVTSTKANCWQIYQPSPRPNSFLFYQPYFLSTTPLPLRPLKFLLHSFALSWIDYMVKHG